MALGIPASLACPDAERLALAHEATRWLAARSGAQAAFLSGGLMSGLGTPTSDFDVYLVETADASPARRQLSIDKTIRVDVHEVPRLELERVVDQLTADRPHDDETAFLCSTAELKLATRLYAAEIVAGAAIVTPLRDRLRSGHHLRRHVLQSWLTSAHSDLEDFAGLRASGDLDAAAMVGREALIAGGKAVAAANDDIYLGRKWVWRQLRRSAPRAFPMADFQRLFNGDLSVGQSDDGLRELAAFTRTCLAAAATLGWHAVSLDRWAGWHRGSGPLHRDAEFHPRAHGTGVVITKPAERWVRLRPDVALIWGLCNGVTTEEVVVHASALGETEPAYRGLTRDRCRHLLTRLIEAGLVHHVNDVIA
ncbi:hypothetical protein HD597_000286 [Nonomuraea thailandensis]|uniref:Nucleotidyltransferase domain-containing protein n=1 Tax=Nonomuraea thailandensis TaxID=1188745 RepID=A0A9X2GDE5_9ACTN|nr:hypothetical protein [Nonomuraea thailandensis]MCP2353266.1 hypothetical protein [Nonomuraea thailandensis]